MYNGLWDPDCIDCFCVFFSCCTTVLDNRVVENRIFAVLVTALLSRDGQYEADWILLSRYTHRSQQELNRCEPDIDNWHFLWRKKTNWVNCEFSEQIRLIIWRKNKILPRSASTFVHIVRKSSVETGFWWWLSSSTLSYKKHSMWRSNPIADFESPRS